MPAPGAVLDIAKGGFWRFGPQEIVLGEHAYVDDTAVLVTMALVHTPDYLAMLRLGTMDAKAARRLGLPWSPSVLRRSRLEVQATLNVTMMALQDGTPGLRGHA